MESQGSGTSLESVNGILMGILVVEGTESQLAMSHSQVRLPVVELECIQLSCGPRRCQSNSPKTQAAAKTKGGSLQTDSGTLLLRTIHTELIENGEVELVPTWSLHPYVLVSLIWGGTLRATKREI